MGDFGSRYLDESHDGKIPCCSSVALVGWCSEHDALDGKAEVLRMHNFIFPFAFYAALLGVAVHGPGDSLKPGWLPGLGAYLGAREWTALSQPPRQCRCPGPKGTLNVCGLRRWNFGDGEPPSHRTDQQRQATGPANSRLTGATRDRSQSETCIVLEEKKPTSKKQRGRQVAPGRASAFLSRISPRGKQGFRLQG